MSKSKQLSKHFNSSEFDSPDLLYSGLKMDLDFILLLEAARLIAGVVFKINSGYRSVKHNKKVGGKSNSSHLSGNAVDIACEHSRNRYLIVNSLLAAGFTRIGVGKTFIHVDNDSSRSLNVIWIYK